MKLINLKINNFQSFESVEIDFSNISVASIDGVYKNNSKRSNGSGKSSIFDAIIYALYGKSRTKSESELIRRGQNEMYVELIVLHNKNKIKIIREKSNNSNDLSLIINDTNQSENKRETQEKINKIIGMDFELFVATVFFQQMNADTFTTATPSVRKEYLKNILQLDIYDQALNEAKSKYNEIEEKITKYESQVEYIKGNNISNDITSDEKKLNVLNNKINNLSDEIINYEKKLEDYNSSKIKINNITKQGKEKKSLLEYNEEEKEQLIIDIDNLKKKIVPITFDKNEYNKMKSEYKIITNKIAKEKEKNIKYKTQKDVLEERINLLGNEDSCPTCESDISGERKELLKTKLLQSKKILIDKFNDSNIEIKKLNTILQIKNNILDKYEKEYEIFNKQNTTLEVNKTKLQSKNLSYKKVINDIEVLNKELVILRESLKSEKVNCKKEYSKEKLIKMRDECSVLKAEYSELENSITQYKKQKSELLKIKKKINIEREKLNIYSSLKNIFGKNGIVSEIIKTSIDEIEDTCNSILIDINKGEMEVNFEMIRENKDKNIKDTLDIKIITDTGETTYESLSGGEKTIVNFAIRLSLSKLLCKLNSTSFGFIVLDEVFGALDEFNRDKISAVINYLKKEFGQIFVISQDAMKERFENYIKVMKNNGISSIKEII